MAGLQPQVRHVGRKKMVRWMGGSYYEHYEIFLNYLFVEHRMKLSSYRMVMGMMGDGFVIVERWTRSVFWLLRIFSKPS